MSERFDESRAPSSCEVGDEVEAALGGAAAPATSRVLRQAGFRWDGVEPRAYKDPDGSWLGVSRHALVGAAGPAAPFHVRYFEVEPDGYTSFERHEHAHVVVPLRGHGEVRLGERWENVGFGDLVYVAPDEPHQLRATGGEAFGFLCIVPADRDRPVRLD